MRQLSGDQEGMPAAAADTEAESLGAVVMIEGSNRIRVREEPIVGERAAAGRDGTADRSSFSAEYADIGTRFAAGARLGCNELDHLTRETSDWLPTSTPWSGRKGSVVQAHDRFPAWGD